MKYLLLVLFTSHAWADAKKIGMKVPELSLPSGDVVQIEQHLKSIKAYDFKDNFKLDYFCSKIKNPKGALGATMECKLINID